MHFLSNHKRLTFILLSLLTLLLVSSIIYGVLTISPTDNESYRTSLLEKMEQASSFGEFTNALFCYEVTSDSITTAYTLKNPSAYQIPELSPRLTSFSYKEYEQDRKKQSDTNIMKLLSNTLKQYEANDLNEQEQITCCLLQDYFDLNMELSKYAYYEELLGVTSGVQANLPVTLGEYPLHTEENVKNYLSLLTQIPDYFKNVISYEKHRTSLGFSSPDFLLNETRDGLSAIIESLNTENNCFTDTFDERINEIAGLSDKKIAAYQDRNQDYVKKYVLPAYENLYHYVDTALLAGDQKEPSTQVSDTTETVTTDTVMFTTGSATPRLPAPSITKKVNSQSSSASGNYAPDLHTAYGLSTLPNGDHYYSLLVKSNTGSDKSVTDLITLTDQTLKQVLGDVLNIALTDPEAYLYYCENAMDTYYESPEAILEALSLMIHQDYPVLKKAPSYRIKSVPDSLAQSVSPAFYMIPAIDDYTNNTIYINSLFTNAENGNLFTTLAHEGFPGHLYQTVYFNDTHPDAIRQLLNYPGYVEGWATYVEMNAFTFLDYPLPGDSLCRLYQDETIINLALCSRIDMGVNYEGWTLSDVNQYFEDNGFNSYYGADVYSYVVESPATYLRYFIGYLEIKNLKEEYKNEKMENYTEKDFHKDFLDIGPGDFTTIRKHLLTNP